MTGYYNTLKVLIDAIGILYPKRARRVARSFFGNIHMMIKSNVPLGVPFSSRVRVPSLPENLNSPIALLGVR